MNVAIDLTASEEAQLFAFAKAKGLKPAEWVKRLVRENLRSGSAANENDPDHTVSRRHDHEAVRPPADDATMALFARWAEEDARLTDEERAENDRIYAEIEKNGIPRVRI